MQLHIVIDIRRLGFFGIGTYIRNLVRGLSRIDPENRYTLIARPGAEGLTGLGPNFQVMEYDRPDTDLSQNVRFPLFLKNLRASLYHIPLNYVPFLMPRPYVLTIHDLSSITFQSGSDFRGTAHRERYRRGAARAARIIAVSNATRRDLQDVLGLSDDRIHTIYGGPDPAFAEQDRTPEEQEQILQRYQIQPPFILYAGTIRPHKNVGRLVEAFAVLRSQLENDPDYRDLKLVIIGDELSRYPEVRRAVIATRMEPFVRFLGFVPVDTLKVFYRAAAVFAFPSLSEGFGLAPLEAMACGTPVVASDLPALIEAVGDAAELVSPDNVFDVARGIRSLLMDLELRQRRIQAGLLQAKRFHWDETARAVLDVYKGVI
jgi:glycosyltransferase involved in cell wall biosynthesis